MVKRISRRDDDPRELEAQVAQRALNYIGRTGLKPGAPSWVGDLVAPATHLANEAAADMSADGWRWEMIYELVAGMARDGIEFDVTEILPSDWQYLLAWMASSPLRVNRCTEALRYLPCESRGIRSWIRRVAKMEITDLIGIGYFDELTSVAEALRRSLRASADRNAGHSQAEQSPAIAPT
ncbi:MAG: hypothetical protein WAW99_05615 [Candidatus Bipolaricaulis anaerobius]